jgi:predicted nucleic acid-binding protein
MIVVSDTTAISNLIQIQEFELLRELYGEIVIPKGVYEELLALAEFDIPINNLLDNEWIDVREVSSQRLIEKFQNKLDLGEAQAIVLAIEMKADYLLIDEKEGRKIARENQLEIVGTLGILINGKKLGLIQSIKDKMDKLREVGFWISDSLYHEIIEIEKQL